MTWSGETSPLHHSFLRRCEYLAWRGWSQGHLSTLGEPRRQMPSEGKIFSSKKSVNYYADHAAFTAFTARSAFWMLMETNNNLIRFRFYLTEFSKSLKEPSNFFAIQAVVFSCATESYGCWWHHVTFLLVLGKVEHLEKTARVRNARGSKGK